MNVAEVAETSAEFQQRMIALTAQENAGKIVRPLRKLAAAERHSMRFVHNETAEPATLTDLLVREAARLADLEYEAARKNLAANAGIRTQTLDAERARLRGKQPEQPNQPPPPGDAHAITGIDSEGRPRKQADVLLEIGRTHTLFRDTDGSAFACVVVNGHQEAHRVDSATYREVLAREYLNIVGRGSNRNSIADAITTISSLARFNGDTRRVWIRVAMAANKIVIDMGGADWRCIEVDATGWRWCKKPPMFRRTGASLPLPEPKEPDFSKLWAHVNIADEHRPLLAGFMLAALKPSGPYPQLHLSGEQGSGKSTIAKILKALTDPSTSPLRAPPKDPRDLLVGALNAWCLSLDNLSFITPQLSDALCRLSTGGAISERQLYTNAEEVLIEVQRPVILNGIEDLATRPDLADRGLHIECETISHRRPEQELWASFDADKPHIFGALLQGLVLALRDHQQINLGRGLPRMADFATWAAAGIPALGFSTKQFVTAYSDNIAAGQTAALDSSPVGRAIERLMDTRGEWAGTAAELGDALSGVVDEAVLRSHAWPKSPRGISGAIRRLAPALRSAGIEITSERLTNPRRTRTITLCNRGKQSSTSSEPSENHAAAEYGADGLDGLDGQNPALHNEEGAL